MRAVYTIVSIESGFKRERESMLSATPWVNDRAHFAGDNEAHCNTAQGRKRIFVENSFYSYQDAAGMTRQILEWLADKKSPACKGISFSANTSLEGIASNAIVNSRHAQTIQRLEFSDVGFSAKQLEDLLRMPALKELRIAGGESWDWAGPKYVWSTLGSEHVNVLKTNPRAKRLRVLEIRNQEFSDDLGHELRKALPQLEKLVIEDVNY